MPRAASVTRLVGRVLDVVLPVPCLGCGRRVESPPRTLDLCSVCRHQLQPAPEPGCATCGRTLWGHLPEGYRCGPCRRQPPPFDRLYCAFDYTDPMGAVIQGLKFRRLDYLAEELALELTRCLGKEATLATDMVTFVPLHWRRRLSRGFDQAEAIARPLAKALGLPAARLLTRRRATPTQARRQRPARLANLRGAFRALPWRSPRGRRILLVDDVVTTGATLSAAAASLMSAGACSVRAAAVARTPEKT